MVGRGFGIHAEIDDEARQLQHRSEDRRPPDAPTPTMAAVPATTTGYILVSARLPGADRVRSAGARVNHITPLFIRMPVPGNT